jgi:hypothetical protein
MGYGRKPDNTTCQSTRRDGNVLEATPMTRREVLDVCYFARTPLAVRIAFEARAEYLKDHPDDDEVIDMRSMLSRLKEGFDLEEEAAAGESERFQTPTR